MPCNAGTTPHPVTLSSLACPAPVVSAARKKTDNTIKQLATGADAGASPRSVFCFLDFCSGLQAAAEAQAACRCNVLVCKAIWLRRRGGVAGQFLNVVVSFIIGGFGVSVGNNVCLWSRDKALSPCRVHTSRPAGLLLPRESLEHTHVMCSITT